VGGGSIVGGRSCRAAVARGQGRELQGVGGKRRIRVGVRVRARG